MSEPTNQTYELRELKDLLQIPPDRLEVFLSELKDALEHAHALLDLHRELATDWPEDELIKQLGDVSLMNRFTWNDDGKTDKRYSLLDKSGEKEIAALVIKKKSEK